MRLENNIHEGYRSSGLIYPIYLKERSDGMNRIEVFTSETFGSVRTMVVNGAPWFIASDVCKALDISDPTKAMQRLDEDEGTRIEIAHPQSPGKTMLVNAVNEPGLYSLVLGSRKPEAKAFKRWITHDVIPSIRQHGGYIAGQDSLSDDELLAKALVVAQNKIAERDAKLAEERAKNRVLAGENLEWADRSFILKAVRSLGSTFGDYAKAWMLFKQELLYKHHINLKTRQTNAMKAAGKKTEIPVLDMLHEDEVVQAAQSIISLCTEHGVDLSWVTSKSSAAREAVGM